MLWILTNLLLLLGLNVFSAVAASEDAVTRPTPPRRIVNGTDSSIGDFPWQGFLVRGDGGVCGCSLITTQWAITAAHCTHGYAAKDVTLYFGFVNRQKLSGASMLRVTQIIEHENYENTYLDNDIALLRLEGTVSITSIVRPILLPAREDTVPDDIRCNITGWGTTYSGSAVLPVMLQQAEIQIVSETQCKQWLPGYIFSFHICAGYEAGAIDTCQGDSGGPLSCYDAGRREFVLQGIVSFGFGCGDAKSPGVYTRVAYYADWIATNTASTATTTEVAAATTLTPTTEVSTKSDPATTVVKTSTTTTTTAATLTEVAAATTLTPTTEVSTKSDPATTDVKTSTTTISASTQAPESTPSTTSDSPDDALTSTIAATYTQEGTTPITMIMSPTTILTTTANTNRSAQTTSATVQNVERRTAVIQAANSPSTIQQLSATSSASPGHAFNFTRGNHIIILCFPALFTASTL